MTHRRGNGKAYGLVLSLERGVQECGDRIASNRMGSSLFSPSNFIFWSIGATVAALVWSFQRNAEALRSHRWLGLTAMPGLLALAAFFSLAVHMRSRLRGWPDSCGTHKLPQELVVHFEIAAWLFSVVFVTLCCMPLVLALFAAVPQLRSRIIYPACFSVANWLCFFTTFLAPDAFQNWWWD